MCDNFQDCIGGDDEKYCANKTSSIGSNEDFGNGGMISDEASVANSAKSDESDESAESDENYEGTSKH